MFALFLAAGPAASTVGAQEDLHRSEARYQEASGDITMALVGDAIITRRMSVFDEPDLLAMVDVLRESTVSIANLEMLFHEYGSEIIPASTSGGAYMTADPELAHELAWMGFDMVALANNHSFDWGIGGIEATHEAIAAAGLEGAGTGPNLARAVVDAGADVFFAHGPRVLRGIELYRGKPIFYSLSNFIFQNETLDYQPGDNYEEWDLPPEALVADFHDRRAERGRDWLADVPNWESVIASPVFRGGQLVEVVLHPISLGYGLGRPGIGRPMLARGLLARQIIERLQELSEPFGTRIDFDGEVGRIPVSVPGNQEPR